MKVTTPNAPTVEMIDQPDQSEEKTFYSRAKTCPQRDEYKGRYFCQLTYVEREGGAFLCSPEQCVVWNFIK